jgi:hypothetical protein
MFVLFSSDLSKKRCNAFQFWVIFHNYENNYSGKKWHGQMIRMVASNISIELHQVVHKKNSKKYFQSRHVKRNLRGVPLTSVS